MLPIFMVICAIYGASDGHRNNFGRNLVIQNLFQVNIGANAFYTGSGAHLLAISLIAGFVGSCDFGYKEWLVAVGPMSLIILVVGLLLGIYVFFPMKKEEQKRRPGTPEGRAFRYGKDVLSGVESRGHLLPGAPAVGNQRHLPPH